jgi:hypothetical protein
MRLLHWLSPAGTLLSSLALLGACLVLADRLGKFREGPSTEGGLEHEASRSARLDRDLQVGVGRVNRKMAIARELIDERLTLPEAAAHFHTLHRGWGEVQRREFYRLYVRDSYEEGCCSEVIAWVRNVLWLSNPSVREAIATRLEEQLRAELRRGPIRLPDVGP